MASMFGRRCRSRRAAAAWLAGAALAAAACAVLYRHCFAGGSLREDHDLARRLVDTRLEEALLLERGQPCEMPELDPFAIEVVQFDKKTRDVSCAGTDWVKCYHSKCRVVDSIQASFRDIMCTYRDILYHSDMNYTVGPCGPVVAGEEAHELRESDHVKVACVGRRRDSGAGATWSGNSLGLRPTAPPPPPPGRQRTYSVLVFAFDSTARNGFIRHMPKTWKTLQEIGAVVMEGYNIVGDATASALFPIFTGHTELELPDARRREGNNRTLDSFPFIFHKLKQDGYRTAYFEDRPEIGTFQFRLNGFRRQPADHYLRAFYLEEDKQRLNQWFFWTSSMFCVGDTPRFQLMINITQQFLELEGKKFIFTFISDITHDDPRIQVADDDTSAFLRGLLKYAEDTLVIVMSDHGPRFAAVRDTLQGKLEERLPLLAVKLPARLERSRPLAARALRHNARALSTPHDLHATILDVLDMTQHWSPHRVRGAELRRGLTLLQPIPRNRSCSEAGIEPHWCACVVWQNVSSDDPFFHRPADALVNYINALVAKAGERCAARTLKWTAWVVRRGANSRLRSFASARDYDGYLANFNANTKPAIENYQTKIAVGPGHGVFEATMAYRVREDRLDVDVGSISRTNAYRDEAACVKDTHPQLSPYCYCH